MDQQNYPRPDSVVGPYPKDKIWGIVTIALSGLGVCCGLGLAGLGGVLGIAGAGAAVSGTTGAGGADARGAAAGLGIGGGILALIGFAIMASYGVQIAGGIGIMKSRRWGFLLTGVLSVVSILLHLGQLPQGIVWIAISGVIAYYCYARLSGKEGPTPV